MVHVCMPMCVMFGADFLHSMLLPISVFGTIFKIDSTKKAVKKLLGSAVNSASWATNIENERGEVLISVLTELESVESLSNMAIGLMDHYVKASVDSPILLYTDRACCSQQGKFKICVSSQHCTNI